MKIYDITVPVHDGLPTFPGDPGVEIHTVAALERGDAANVSLLHFGAHTATHVDAPAHFIAGASRVAEMPLASLIGPAQVLEIPSDADAITPAHLLATTWRGPERILFKTRNSAFWSELDKGFRTDFTYIAPEAAQLLVENGVRLVGIDYLSVEKYGVTDFATHHIVLSAGVVIVEGLDLREVPAGNYELLCLPLKLSGGAGDGAPARAVLRELS